MSNVYCCLCKKTHRDTQWRHRKWIEGQDDAWACSKWFTPQPYEFVPDALKEERKKYAKEMVQPFRQGELSKEFTQLYPNQVKGMLKDGYITEKQVRGAHDVWRKDMKGLD